MTTKESKSRVRLGEREGERTSCVEILTEVDQKVGIQEELKLTGITCREHKHNHRTMILHTVRVTEVATNRE